MAARSNRLKAVFHPRINTEILTSEKLSSQADHNGIHTFSNKKNTGKNLFAKQLFLETLRTPVTKSRSGVADTAPEVSRAQLHSNILWQLSSNSLETIASKTGFATFFRGNMYSIAANVGYRFSDVKIVKLILRCDTALRSSTP